MPKRRLSPIARLLNRPVVLAVRTRWSAVSQRWIEPRLAPAARRLRYWGVLSSINRFILTIGDEGATLVHVRGVEVIDAILIGPENEDGLGTLRGFLDADPQAELIVAVDVLEQMYREEQLPKVGRFDRGTVVKRRLDLAFPHDQLRAALPLSGGAKAIFAALPETEHIRQWVEFLESLPNPVTGFCLMPLEAADIAESLGPSGEGETRQIWRVLATQQATSGFRQIFETEGRMVVTRLTQRPASDLSAEAVAQLIERELRSSISYLKRLGYSEQDRLDLVVIDTPEVCRTVLDRDLPVASLTAYTPHQAGFLLGLGVVAPEGSGFSDVLMAQWLATKTRPMMALQTTPLRQKRDQDRLFRACFGMAAALSLFTLFELAGLTFNAFDTATTTDVLAAQLATERQAAESIAKRLAALDVGIEDVTLVDNTVDTIDLDSVDPAALLMTIAGLLGDGMAVDKIAYENPRVTGDLAQGVQGAPRPRAIEPKNSKGPAAAATLTFTVHLPVDLIQTDVQLEQAKQLRERLQAALPDYQVEITRLPAETLHNQVIQGSVTQAAGPTSAATIDYALRRKA